jgi:hypothetical protein
VRSLLPILCTLVLTACGGGGGGSSTPVTPSTTTLTQVMAYQNADVVSQIFNTQVADLNGDGLEDVVVSGWASEPSGSTLSPHGKVPVKILIQQSNGSLQDQTDTLLGSGNNMIWGSQRIIIADFDNDGKPDIFLGGFQDSPGQGDILCCTVQTSVMFWNNGSSFSRYDFTDPVWAHAVCIGDLTGTGLPSIVMGAANSFYSNIYVNNGNRNFTMTHTTHWIGSGGQCNVIRDATSGNVAIISGASGFNQQAGYDGVIQVFDSHLNFISMSGLPGSEDPNNYNPAIHDIVNIISIDLNNDGLMDMVLTDNNTDVNNGTFTALINQGNFTFSNQTSTYFPNQTNNLYFQYYTRTLTLNNQSVIFASTVNTNWNFSTLPSMWLLNNGAFSAYQQLTLSNDVGTGYIFPTVYKTSTGSLSVLMIQNNNNNQYEFYTRAF